MRARLSGYARALSLCAVAALLCVCVGGCSGGSSGQAVSPDQMAATILGVDITEQEVSDYVQDLREETLRTDDETWLAYLQDEGRTAADIRTIAIDELASNVVIRHWADELGLSPDEQAVDNQIEGMRTSLAVDSDEAWADALKEYHTDPDKLRETFEIKSLQEQIYETVVEVPSPTDDEMASYIEGNLAGQTVKKVTLVLGDDREVMQALLDRMAQAGSGESAIALAEEAAADGSVRVVDYGWYFSGSSSTQIDNAIAELGVGELHDELLTNGDTFEILYVTDEYEFSASAADASDMPEDLAQEVSTQATPDAWEKACNDWLHEEIDKYITVYDMPEGLAYDVDGSAGRA